MPEFADHFSATAASYASFRPHYPAALFDWLAASTSGRQRVWDCGTGSGQAAVALSRRFAEVVATDPSVAQLANAARAAGVSYVAMTAERGALADSSVDLVTVAQALHWFDRAAFFAETRRVLRPHGALAVWSYGLLTIDSALDTILGHFYHDTLRSYWPAERALVDSGYAGVALPFPEVESPTFEMEAIWSFAQLGGYLSTWSAVGRYRSRTGEDPVPFLMRRLESSWGALPTRRVCWPLVVRLARRELVNDAV